MLRIFLSTVIYIYEYKNNYHIYIKLQQLNFEGKYSCDVHLTKYVSSSNIPKAMYTKKSWSWVSAYYRYLHPRRGAQRWNPRAYSAATMYSKYHDFLAIFALAHSKINQIAKFLDDNVRNDSNFSFKP